MPQFRWNSSVAKNLSTAFVAVVLVGALFVIRKDLGAYHFKDIVQSVHDVPSRSIYLALGLTVLNYVLLAGYDILALRFIGSRLPYRNIALNSFIGYAFSYNLGFVLGNAMRSRLYSLWGVSAEAIGKALGFLFLTFWLGFCTTAGIAFVWAARPLPALFGYLPFASTRPLGLILLAISAAYIAWISTGHRAISVAGFRWQFPGVRVSALQIALASFDWVVASSVLFTLLPVKGMVSFPAFLIIYLLAQLATVITHVPGGVGVIESVVLLLLPPEIAPPVLLASLIVYRLVYFIAPLCAAALLFAWEEISARREVIKMGMSLSYRMLGSVTPTVLSYTTFLAGIILLFSGSLPEWHGRLEIMKDILPLPVIELSHFLASLLGVGLLILSRAIRSRIDAAYFATCTLLILGILTSILKGFDYEEALILTIMLAAILPARPYFRRHASVFEPDLGAGWSISMALVIVCSVWLGLFVHRNVSYTSDLWWKFAVKSDAPRFLRASVGAVILLMFYGIMRLLKSHRPAAALPSSSEMEEVIPIVRGCGRTIAQLALLGDKYIHWGAERTAFVMYGRSGRSAIALGDPVGGKDAIQDVAWDYRSLCDEQGLHTAFYQVTPEHLPLYVDMGLGLLKIGEEAVIELADFTMEGHQRQDLRTARNHLERDGYGFAIIERDDVQMHTESLRKISHEWVTEKRTREKGFALGRFLEEYLRNFRIATVTDGHGDIVAFTNLLEDEGKEEVSIDMMRFGKAAPGSSMDYLFGQLLQWAKQSGYRTFSLGMAPLSGLQTGELAPLWNRIGSVIFRNGESFYNFEGLRAYKEKFDPVWEPRYLASSGGPIISLGILTEAAALISGGWKGIIRK